MVSGGEGGGEMERIVQIEVSDGGGGGGQCLETFLVFASRGCYPCLVGRGQESCRVSYNARMTPHSSYISGPQV